MMEEHQQSDLDSYEQGAVEDVERLITQTDRVFYERQVEVLLESKYFHWVTSRAVRELENRRVIETRRCSGPYGSEVKTLRRTKYRYYKREETRLLDLIGRFSDPAVTSAIGARLEDLTLDGFARQQFVLIARNTRQYRDREWDASNHDLDFIFERDGLALGIECKNTLSYIDPQELDTKLSLCDHLGITPVFVVRAMPKSWIEEVRQRAGFTLVLSWWLFPPLLTSLANDIRSVLDYRVGTPIALEDGTMRRFTNWWARLTNQ